MSFLNALKPDQTFNYDDCSRSEFKQLGKIEINGAQTRDKRKHMALVPEGRKMDKLSL